MRDNLPKLTDFSDEVNRAYQTYCSIYLDYYDDNQRHLYDRQVDLYPLRVLEDEGRACDQKLVANMYMLVAMELVKNYTVSLDELCNQYPLFAENRSILKALRQRGVRVARVYGKLDGNLYVDVLFGNDLKCVTVKAPFKEGSVYAVKEPDGRMVHKLLDNDTTYSDDISSIEEDILFLAAKYAAESQIPDCMSDFKKVNDVLDAIRKELFGLKSRISTGTWDEALSRAIGIVDRYER